MEYVRLSEIDLKANIGKRVFICFMARDVSTKLQRDQVTEMVDFNMVDLEKTDNCKIFGASPKQIEMMQNGGVYNAAIDVKPYDKSPNGYSCIIYNIEPNTSIDMRTFVAWATNLDESRRVIENALGSVNNSVVGKIAYHILIKHWTKFSTWAAGRAQHHSRLGDLLTHTAEVVTIADLLGSFLSCKYGESFINRNLLISSALLHDIGKIYEYSVDVLTGNVDYSAEAALATHIMCGLGEIDTAARELGIACESDSESKSVEQVNSEKEMVLLLKHCIASHHGKLEWGSPILPAVPEAQLIFRADQISAEMYKFNKVMRDIDTGESTTLWENGDRRSYYLENGKELT